MEREGGRGGRTFIERVIDLEFIAGVRLGFDSGQPEKQKHLLFVVF